MILEGMIEVKTMIQVGEMMMITMETMMITEMMMTIRDLKIVPVSPGKWSMSQAIIII